MKKYIRRYRVNLTLAVIFAVLETRLTYKFTMESSQIVNILTDREGVKLSSLVIKSVVFLFLSWISNYLYNKNEQGFGIKIVRDLRHDYFEGLFSMKSSGYFEKSKTEYFSDIDHNIEQLRLQYLVYLSSALAGVGQAVVYLIVLFRIHPYIFLATLVCIICPSLAGKVFSQKMSKLEMEEAEKNTGYINRLNENLDGYLVIKESGKKDYFIDSFDKADEAFLTRKRDLNVTSSLLFESMFCLNAFSFVVIILIGSLLINAGKLELSQMVASITLVSISTNTIAQAFKYLVQMVSAKKLKNKILETIPSEETEEEIKIRPQMGLAVRDLSYSYGENQIFSGLSVDLKEGKKYAIIGNSGSGKSSLAKILMKINEGYGGEMTFENGNYLDFNEREIYSCFYYIPQDPVIFKDSLERNIAMEEAFDEEKIKEIIGRVNLGYLYEKNQGKEIDGGSVSGGEKKKIELARALYHGAQAIIFDEPTSGLDPKNADAIEDLIDSLEGVTRIVITHNQDEENLKTYDEVIDIEKYK